MTSQLRIALCVDLAPRKLGSFEAWMLALVAEADRRGHRMDVLSRQPVHPQVAAELSGLGASWTALGELERSILPTAARLRRDYDVLHLNLFTPRGRFALAAYAAWPAAVLWVDHVSGPIDELQRTRPLSTRLLDRYTMRRVRSLAGVSDYVRRRTSSRFRLDADRTRVIYNGVALQRFAPRPNGTTEHAPLTLLCVSHLIREKGVDILLRAVAALNRSDIRLLVAGDGPEQPMLKQLAADLGISPITEFLGLRNDVDSLLRDADMYVHPAVWAEACAYAILEAMASGCAMIVTGTGGNPELVVDGTHGLVVPPGDVPAFAGALERLCNDPTLRTNLGLNARERAQQMFDLPQCARAHLDWCEDCAARR